VNGVNDTLRHIHNISEVNKHFREYMNWGKECKAVRFAMFHPTLKNPINKESMSADEVEEFYRDLPTAEIADLDNFLSGLNDHGSSELDSSVRNSFGVTNSHLALLDELQNWTKANGDRTAMVLQMRMPPLRASQRRISDQIEKQQEQIKDMDKNISIYADKFLSSMNAIRQGTEFQLEAPAGSANFKGLIYPLAKYDREVFALTYKQEVEELDGILFRGRTPGTSVAEALHTEPDDHLRPVWKSYDQLKDLLGDSHSAEVLDFNLTCAAAIRRLVKMVGFMIMKRGMRPLTRAEIQSKHNPLLGGEANPTSLVKQLVGVQIRTVFQEVFPRFLEHIRFLIERPIGLAHASLATGFPDIEKLHDLHAALNDTFSEWLAQSLKDCNKDLVAMMQERLVSFSVDADTRLIHLLRLTPLKDYLDLIPRLEGDRDHDEELDRSEELLSPADHGKHKKSQAYEAYLSVRNVIRSSIEPRPPSNPQDDDDKLEDTMSKGSESEICLEFIEGGLTGISATEHREIYTLVNKLSQKFFMQLKGLLVMELESKVDRHLLEPLEHRKGSDDKLHHEIRVCVSKFKEDGTYEEKMKESLGTDSLLKHLNSKKDRQKKIEEALRVLHKNLRANNAVSRANGATSRM